MPAISVVMPVYNRAAVVERAIRSVLDQDFADFELIVVDDDSTDATCDLIAAIDDARLTLIALGANGGGNAARNRGIEAARSPLLAFLDSDDAYLPNKLGVVVRTFRERPALDVLLDSYIKTYPGQDRPDEPLRNPLLDTNEAVLHALFTRRIWKATPGITVRRAVAFRAGLFDERLKRRQDFDFIIRLAAVAECATTDQLLWIKSYTRDAISADLRNYVASTLAFCERHPQYYGNPPYRRGLALDVARHFMRLIKRRDFAAIRRDARPLALVFGKWGLVRLLTGGMRRLAAHRRFRRR